MPFVFHCFASALNALEKFINFNSIRDWPGKVKGKFASVSVKFSSVIYLTVDNYYLRDFGFISISV